MDISFSSILTWFRTLLTDVLTWFINALLWAWDKIVSKIVDLGLWMFDAVFDCCTATVSIFTTAYSYIKTSPVSYVTSTLNIDLGLKIIFCAFIARFLLRRIPGIG